ncbi:MAG: HAMP domain-containing histidine kinase [Rudaea sp.]|uniref:sensor histidine kinase n=1 Tax=unclassified Rudaea TaxID=2627037 RepID=UPI0010F4B9D4|nr:MULTISPECIES: HAMP domain-containing sensor histidine kinase [unclassified Rudaea]MBN8887401.1 HAMP domain-containing histidine kinase [Rudaea sp.]MBR0344927.1 HAMP domain-containing histidine kinase [Rudaea sp.]
MRPTKFRRRLRSRIIISFALFGFALTALFAAATMYMRARLEDQLVNNDLGRLVKDFVDFKREHPEEDARWAVPRYEPWIYGATKFANVPFDRRQYDQTGVYEVEEPGVGGKLRQYKLAVYKDDGYWAFLRYDVSTQKLNEVQLLRALGVVTVLFLGLSILIGSWLSRRVMSPVTELVQRIRTFRQTRKVEPLAPHFANDEVGELAAALDDYSKRLTAIVQRDRDFNADVSHELRTPLAVISGTTELLLNSDKIDDKIRERLKRIERAAKQSTELTNALLLLSRSERSAPNDGETTDVAKVAEQVIDVYRSHIGRKPIDVHLVVDQTVEVVAPSSVIAVALGNLIGNAFKYTQKGDVIITIGAGRGVVTVEDSGPGIKAEDAEKLFQRGVRGESSEGTKGAGLGLAIVIRLCQLYDWHVGLAPRPQGGAVATLDFRLR